MKKKSAIRRILAITLALAVTAALLLTGCSREPAYVNPVADDPAYATWTLGDFEISYPASYLTADQGETVEVSVSSGDLAPYFNVNKASSLAAVAADPDAFSEDDIKEICDNLVAETNGEGVECTYTIGSVQKGTYGAKEGVKFNYTMHLNYIALGVAIDLDMCQIMVFDGIDLYAVTFASFITGEGDPSVDEVFGSTVYPYIFCK